MVVRVTLHGDTRVGERSDLAFTLADATTGAPIDDLQPYSRPAGAPTLGGS